MTSLFDKLNLRPNERRLVIFVAIIVFIIVNWLWVWPEFAKWGTLQKRQKDALELLRVYNIEVDRTKVYERQLAELKEQGATVASEDQALKLATTVQNQALLSGVQNNTYNAIRQTLSGATKPNQFFEEQSGVMNVTAEEKNLIDFLYNLGTSGSLIRVRTMSLSPDPQRQKLQGNLTFVASYAKKAPPKVAAAGPARTNSAPAAATSPRSTNQAAAPKVAAATTTNAAPGLMQRLKNWGNKPAAKTNAPNTNAPTKK